MDSVELRRIIEDLEIRHKRRKDKLEECKAVMESLVILMEELAAHKETLTEGELKDYHSRAISSLSAMKQGLGEEEEQMKEEEEKKLQWRDTSNPVAECGDTPNHDVVLENLKSTLHQKTAVETDQ